MYILCIDYIDVNIVTLLLVSTQQCSQSMWPLRLHFLGHFCQSVALSVTTAATKLLGASSLGVGQPSVCGYRWHV